MRDTLQYNKRIAKCNELTFEDPIVGLWSRGFSRIALGMRESFNFETV